MFSRHTFFGGRRQDVRRLHEQEGMFVDRYGSGLFLVVTLVAMLNILDAFFTVLFLSYGGREVNPIVDASLSLGLWPFLTMKSLGIGLCVGFLTITKNFRVSRIGLSVVFLGYLTLLGWHGYLYTSLPDLAKL